ncbi:MAG: fumarylacetoacetate hydrolase family protein, partial [Chloroflexi bacterium]|nr:fumarylacetoacetate hydrolase family protein [Chloroflexota bacterium]
MTLEPGDMIFTGTPGVPDRLRPGDVVEVEIDGIGILRNYVADEA